MRFFNLITKNKVFRLYYMKIVNPNDTTHVIKLIPRYNVSAVDLDLFLTNEENNETTEIPISIIGFSFSNNYSILDGKLTLTFDFDFLKNDRYSFKLLSENEIVFRGKIFATTQETQDFKQTNNLYYEY